MSALLRRGLRLGNFNSNGGRVLTLHCQHCTDSRIYENRITRNNASSTVFHKYGPCLLKSTLLSKHLTNSSASFKYIDNVFPFQNISTLTGHLSQTSVLLSNHQLSKVVYHNQCRHYKTSFNREDSKVEKTVKALKDQAKETSEDQLRLEEEKKKIGRFNFEKNPKVLLQRLWGWLKHMYHGFRLLGIDIGICGKLLWKIVKGTELTRRESNQLVRTTADMFRIVPLMVFLVIPFLELLLPFALMMFPNMLPSTFEEEKDKNSKKKKQLKAKIEMARFLQKTIQDIPVVKVKKVEGQTAETFSAFLEKIKEEGVQGTVNKDIMKFAKLFEDEITLDNMSRQQLRACCTFLNITPMGTDALLRFHLEFKLRKLHADDKIIEKEGVDSLNSAELQSANRARGMRAMGVSDERLREQLQQWIQLHLHEKIPPSLLLLSRTLYLPDSLSVEEKLQATISKLPGTAADEAKVKVAEMAGEEVDNKTKMDIIKREEEIIKEEKAQKDQEDKTQKDLEDQIKEEKDLADAQIAKETLTDKAEPIQSKTDEGLTDKAAELEPPKKSPKEAEEEVVITTEDLDLMEDVLEKVAKEKKIDVDKETLEDLKEDVMEYKEDLEDLKSVKDSDSSQVKESKAASRLSKKVESMIQKVEKKQRKMQDEVEQTESLKNNLVSMDEVMLTLKSLKKNTVDVGDADDDEKIAKIFKDLDADGDGNIDVEETLKCLELLTQEKVNLSDKQLQEISSVLNLEELLDVEEKKEEQKQKAEQKMNEPK